MTNPSGQNICNKAEFKLTKPDEGKTFVTEPN